MKNLASCFILTGVAFALIGMPLGIWMGINQDFENRHFHAHINLVGWVATMLFGLAYRAYPVAARTALARIHYWVALVGALFFLPGIYLARTVNFLPPVVLGSLLTLLVHDPVRRRDSAGAGHAMTAAP